MFNFPKRYDYISNQNCLIGVSGDHLCFYNILTCYSDLSEVASADFSNGVKFTPIEAFASDINQVAPLARYLGVPTKRYAYVKDTIYQLEAYTLSLSKLPSWRLGTVYGFVWSPSTKSIGAVDLSARMRSTRSKDVFEAFTHYDLEHPGLGLRLLGLLVVISKSRDAHRNILVSCCSPMARELSPLRGERYEDPQALLNAIFDSVIVTSDLLEGVQKVKHQSFVTQRGIECETLTTRNDSIFCLFTDLGVDAKGSIPYYTKNCIGYGDLETDRLGGSLSVFIGHPSAYAFTIRNGDCDMAGERLPCSLTTQFLIERTFEIPKRFSGGY